MLTLATTRCALLLNRFMTVDGQHVVSAFLHDSLVCALHLHHSVELEGIQQTHLLNALTLLWYGSALQVRMSCACHAEVCIVGGLLQVRQGVVEFMPHSFAVVNAASTKFKDVERRFNYTTPKTFLELIKLYKGVLGRKRKATTDNIDRLETGLTKLQKTKKDVDVLVEEAKRMAVQVRLFRFDAGAAQATGEPPLLTPEQHCAALIGGRLDQGLQEALGLASSDLRYNLSYSLHARLYWLQIC